MTGSSIEEALPGQGGAHGWRRLHPVTPLLRGWKVIAATLAALGHQGISSLNGLRSGITRAHGSHVLLTVGGVFLAVLLLMSAWMFLSWRMTRYRVTGDVVEFHAGVLFRQQRQAKLDRLQAVDIVRPLLGRIFGLSELRIEVAGGHGSDFNLSYLTDHDANRLRRVLLAAAAGVQADDEAEAPEAPERPVFTLGGDRLLLSTLLSGAAVAVACYVLAALAWGVWMLRWGGADVRDLGTLVGFTAPSLGVFATVWSSYSRRFGFQVAQSPDGIRLRHGLLEHRAQTLPPGRVQAVEIRQPLLYRLRGWWTVTMNVAGYGQHGSEDHESSATLLAPAVDFEELLEILPLVIPDLGHPDPVDVLRSGLTGTSTDGVSPRLGFVCAPRRARLLDLVGWRRHGALVTGTALLLRQGVLRRRLILVPHARMQSVGAHQGPVQRRLGTATFVLHSTPGPVRPRVAHLRAEDVAALVSGQVARAATARAMSGPEKWMGRAQ